MAKVLSTTGISYKIEEIIKGAEKSIWLVSPYLKFDDRIKELIKSKTMMGIRVTVVYGKKDINQKEKEWLDSLENVVLRFKQNLHAKCYMNENECIITSMNLYGYSQRNNLELGVGISREDDAILYKDTVKEVLYLTSGTESRTVDKVGETSVPKCKCNVEMTRRKGKSGKPSFWGCSNFGQKGSCRKVIEIT
jgi:phosphatidylserine/phosphatidylglycerophosphate/cardiolipin synthase-like enzyme